MRNRINFYACELFAACLILASESMAAQPPLPAAIAPLTDRVKIKIEGDWGSAPRENVEKMLYSTAGELLRFCPERRLGTIVVRHHADVPITLYQKGPHGEHQVLLEANNTYWSQYDYQFAHELTHILCNCDRRKAGCNLWFEETLCETASLFSLRKMAVAWKTKPPYANWTSFAPHFDEYADAMLARRDRRLPPDRNMAEWFREHAASLAEQRKLTDESKLVAAYLVALFEDDPSGWETLATLNLGPNDADLDFRANLEGWKQRVPERQRSFVGKIEGLFFR
jgi:hypothetical protein